MKFNWIGSAFEYGEKINFFSISNFGVELIFNITPTTDPEEDYVFKIKTTRKNPNTINKTIEIYEEVKEVYLILTDEDFRKKFKHVYQIIKFVTDNYVVSIGAYNDNGQKLTVDNTYLICTVDFINLLARSEKIENAEDLKNTPFSSLMCIFSIKELTKELLK